MKAAISAGSFTPGARSTPEETSTAFAPLAAIAVPTFAGVNPPAKIQGKVGFQPCSNDHEKDCAFPPGRVASGGALASSTTASIPSAAGGRSSAAATSAAHHTARPKR